MPWFFSSMSLRCTDTKILLNFTDSCFDSIVDSTVGLDCYQYLVASSGGNDCTLGNEPLTLTEYDGTYQTTLDFSHK